MEFSEILVELRKVNNVTQTVLAEKLNIDKSTVAKYETGKSLPSVPMLIKIAKYFEVSTDYLLGLED